VGLSYMLLGEARQGQDATPANDPSQVKEWFYIGPHIMVVLPDSAKTALRGINQDLSNNQPYTSLPNLGHSRCKGRRQNQGGANEINRQRRFCCVRRAKLQEESTMPLAKT
jgi:hypothetical protein